MRKLRFITASILLGLFVSMPVSVAAQAASTFGGNNAADYQPPTRNPQSGATANLQPNSSGLQTNQSTVTQQNLPAVSNLRVTTTATTANLTTDSDTTPEHGVKRGWLEVIMLTVVVLLGLYLAAIRRKKAPVKEEQPVPTPVTPTIEESAPKPKPTTTKKKRNTTRSGKKKSTAKKKSKK